MVSVKEYRITEEGGNFYIDCLLKGLPINVKIELSGEQFSKLKSSLKTGEENETTSNVYMFNKIGYISFPTTVVFFPEKNLIYTKLLALRLPKSLSEAMP